MLRSIFRYPGGKVRRADAILSRFRSENPSSFYEPFVGGGGVLVRAAQRWQQADLRATDLNPHVSAFWRVLGDGRAGELCAAVEPLTLEFYNACEACPDNDPDEVRRALRFLVVNKGGFNGYIKRGTPPVGGRAQRGKWLVDWCWKPEKVRAHVAELGRLLAGRLKCERLSVFDSPWLDQSAAIYLDPPYVTAGPKMYGEYGSFDHERLRDRLRTVRGEWVLSYDDHPSIRSLYMGFRVEGEDVISSRGLSAGKLKTKGEVLVRSPILDSAHRTEALLNQIPDSEAAWTW